MTGGRPGLMAVMILVLPLLGADRHRAGDAGKGVLRHESGAFEGYTLFAPLRSTTTYLVDMRGRVVHTWESDVPPGHSVYLLKNGHLLRCGRDLRNGAFHGGGIGGRVCEYDWDGKLVWEYVYSDEQHCQHHDIEPLPNGNVLILAWERKSDDEAIAAGRNPDLLHGRELWADHIIEVKPEGQRGGTVVWQWHVWDHLVQDHDSTRANFGFVEDNPARIDINFVGGSTDLSSAELRRLRSLGYVGGSPGGGGQGGQPDWNHTNSIAYNAELDQIVLSVLGFDEIWVIDHSTTTAEAAGSAGGRWGQGGDLLYRWGNPQTYRAGTAADRRLFAQHDARWIEPGFPGAGNLLVFNNGRGRREGRYSTVDEIASPLSRDRKYRRKAGAAFGPAKPAWTFKSGEAADFFSGHISGAQRLANGNTLICCGEKGHLFEVTRAGKVVWEYANPHSGKTGMQGPPPGAPGVFGPPPDRRPGAGGVPRGRPQRTGPAMGGRQPGPPGPPGGHDEATAMFRATRIAPNHPGLAGRDLSPKEDPPANGSLKPGKGGKR